MMVRRFTLFVVFWLILSGSYVSAAPLFWEVENPRTGSKAYLLGSVHFGTPELYPLHQEIELAYLESDALVVELDVGAVPSHVAAEVMRQKGRYRDGETLLRHLPESMAERLGEVCLQLGLPVSAVEYLKPWLVAIQLTAIQIRQVGYDDRMGIDRHFIERVKSDGGGKELFELETFSEQLSIFGDLSHEEQMFFLEQTLQSFDQVEAMLVAILKAWKDGDGEALEQLISIGQGQGELADRINSIIYDKRNLAMATDIGVMLNEENKRYFVVVGAGHLVGTSGIPHLFKARELLEGQKNRVKQLLGQ